MCPHKNCAILRQHIVDLDWRKENEGKKAGIHAVCLDCNKLFKYWFLYLEEKEELDEIFPYPIKLDITKTYLPS